MLAATWISHYPPNLKLEGDAPMMSRILKNARVFDLLPTALGLALYMATAHLALGQAQSSATPSARPAERQDRRKDQCHRRNTFRLMTMISKILSWISALIGSANRHLEP